jgi:cytokinin dehydrogenase
MGSISEQPVVSVPDPRLPVPLLASPDVLTAAAEDFGHLVHKVPAFVARPSTAGEVADLVRYADGAGLEVRARGAGHAVAGQSQCDGIVCDVSALDHVFEIGQSSVSVGAGARWSTVLAATLAHGLTPPVLTDYLELSVGGTLSAGGIGGASFIHGPQADHVLELDVVTAGGSVVTCSPTTEPDVFYGVLGKQGRGGIITRAVIPLVPAPERVRRYTVTLPDVYALTGWQTQAMLSGQFGYLEGQIAQDETGNWTYAAEAAAFQEADVPPVASGSGQVEIQELSYLDFCNRMLPGVRLLAGTGDWYRPHPWFSVFLPPGMVTGYVMEALGELLPVTLGPIPMLLYPLQRGPVPAPGLKTPDGIFYSFTILRTVRDMPMLVNAALGHNALLGMRARLAGANDYSITALPYSSGMPYEELDVRQ